MDVLVHLAANSDRVVSKEELLEVVWEGAFVEEGALSQAIHSLRKALSDDARQPQYILTVPKRGYRLVASVRAEPEAGAVEVGEPSAGPPPSLSAPPAATVPSSQRHRWIAGALITVAALAASLVVGLWVARDRPSKIPREGVTRIVVLPFENLDTPGNAYFADGLTEEITKDLASLPSLAVISRTTAMLYRSGARRPLRDIGVELGVDYVLEGSVRWAQGPDGRLRARITPQLIRVADDVHVWAEAFDCYVEDIFKTQAEISSRVFQQLGIALLPGRSRALRERPTENLEAFRAYLRGRELRNQPFYSVEHIRLAVPMFERAVKLDPTFAAAWAELSQTHSYLAFNADPSPAQVERAREALERAQALAPDLPDVRLAQAYFTYRCLEDFETAERQLHVAVRLSPNDSEVLQTLGYVLRRRGRMAEALEKLRQAFALDPRTVRLLWAIAETHRALRDYEQAEHFYAQATSMAPDQPAYWEERALNRLDWTGNVKEARQILEESPIRDHPKLVSAFFLLDFYERQYERALGRLSSEDLRELAPQVESRILTLSSIAYERLGNGAGALRAAKANRAMLEARVARFPREPLYRPYLAVSLAQVGERSEAATCMEHAVQMAAHDAFSGPRILEVQAMMEAALGRHREAIELLARLLATPYQNPISVADLRLNPVWDSLRGDPAFEDLLRDS